ncbi:FkbM family methyltransferase [Rhodocytophaga aerolata]|uniref:FkbM family methyltransferase n=1 Tax=Rhodocytophaga aerolata TaxID=455078 RepID=A0ABT8R9U3_9BACT|nr:FkbM family methyltransferase [Rhodocytophaga aerolata]MDO1448845.1 FkbM family methyltransferase [Rhodocytophaga aerolata]
MISLSKPVLKKIYKMQGKKRFHKLFEIMHNLSLPGMNYGGGGDIMLSGEKFVLEYLQKTLSQKQCITVFDVGANIGTFTREVLATLGEKAQVYCFEPSAYTFKILSKNIGSCPKVKLFNIGLGSTNTDKLLFYNDKGSILASMYERDLSKYNVTLDKQEIVTLEELDSFCNNNKIYNIDFLKLDVEGFEFEVLKGSKSMIANRKIDRIQFEFGGTQIDSRTFFRDFFLLLSPSYNIYRILKDGLYLIDRYTESLEIFLTSNFLAELKA